MTDLSTLKAAVRRHLEFHNRLPEHMALKLLSAIEELERAVEVTPPRVEVRVPVSMRGGVA